MIRLIDLVSSVLGLLFLWPFMLAICLLGYLDTKSPIFIQERVGKNNKTFKLIKFRTMNVGTKSVGTHDVSVAEITPLGSILRKTKLDELPQLINVALGQMSLVGPRPCLPTQKELIENRTQRSVHAGRPGITGLAQVNNIDMSTPKKLAKVDALMLGNMSTCFYFSLIIQTVFGAGSGDKVKQ